MILNVSWPEGVIELAVAPVVIPAATAVKPTAPFEIAPANLSNKGRTESVKDSSR